jgi:hypothetical protein
MFNTPPQCRESLRDRKEKYRYVQNSSSCISQLEVIEGQERSRNIRMLGMGELL